MGNDQNKKIGKRIHQARKQKKISMKKLGEMVGLHESTISRYEKGEIISLDIEKMKEFARALSVNAAWLMGWEDSNIGKTIKSLRLDRNITLFEMSEELHISVDTLKEYEDGIREIPSDLLNVFANYFNTTVDNLVSYTFEKSNTAFVTENKKLPENYAKWEKEIGYNVHFTPEEVDKIIDFAKFLLSQRKGDNK